MSGVYFLQAYGFSTYSWALFHYANPAVLDYVFYVVGLTAWTLRAAAWGKSRSIAAAKANAEEAGQPAFRMAGVALGGIYLITLPAGGAESNWLSHFCHSANVINRDTA